MENKDIYLEWKRIYIITSVNGGKNVKRLSVIFLTLLMMLSLWACKSENLSNIESENSSNVEVELPNKGKKGPSADIIQEDVTKELAKKNPNAVLTGVETIKSLTEDEKFEITLSIFAETSYAEWTYEADMSYIKYDQGWMVDNIDFISEAYTMTGIPTGEEMTEIANNFFSSYDDERLRDLAGIENGNVILDDHNKVFDNASQTYVYAEYGERIIYRWDGHINYKHGTEAVSYSSKWEYDADSDSWNLMELENPDSYRFCGYVIFKINDNFSIHSDFSGEWELENGNPFIISNFTAEHFTASWEGNTAEFRSDATIPHSFDTSSDATVWYADSEQGFYLCMRLREGGTSISIYTYTNMVNLIAMLSISDTLPALNGTGN